MTIIYPQSVRNIIGTKHSPDGSRRLLEQLLLGATDSRERRDRIRAALQDMLRWQRDNGSLPSELGNIW